jgi:uncharacterized protein (TIGR02757 family)
VGKAPLAFSSNGLKTSLDALYETYDFEERVLHDPIQAPKRYPDRRDMEAAAFIAASFAFGSVKAFLPVIDRILLSMGRSPHTYIREFDAVKNSPDFAGIRYRFYTTEDIVGLIHVTGVLLRRHHSLERAFLGHYSEEHPDAGPALAGFVEEALGMDTTPVYGSNLRTRGFKFFFPSPRDGSACKRANLFLRWMVRKKDIDLGLWNGFPPCKLVIPLDTHIARVSRCLGFTQRKTDDWKTALEITSSLRALDPEDPLKYDFALCHRGISGVCAAASCGDCVLRAHR